MHIMINSLYSIIHQFSQILIYGTGHYAREVYPLLKNVGLKNKISSFVVSNLGEENDVDGIPVRAVSEVFALQIENCAVLVAVSKGYEDEIVWALKGLGSTQIIKLTDFIMYDDDLNEMLRNQSEKQFAETLLEEYVRININSVQELEGQRKEFRNCIAQNKKQNIDKHVIVFISGHLTPRSEKIINSLFKKNYDIIVLEYGRRNALIRSEIMSRNIKFIQCRDILEVLCWAIHYNPLVYFFEPIWGDCSGSEIMIRHRNLFGRIVFAAYDVLNDGYVQISDKQKLMERYCLENADGVVWRWFSKEFLEEKKGFVYKGKSIQFLDYCGGYETGQYDDSDKKLKICFVVWGISNFLDKTILKNEGDYAELARIDMILERIGDRRDCLFHVFIGECNDNDREKLSLLEKQHPNFKVFYDTKHSDLIVRISQYDYGCLLRTDGRRIPEMESIDNVYFGSAFQNGVVNKFFDYIDAGIPVIATGHKKFCDYLDRFGVIVKMNVSNLDVDYLKKNKAFYRKNAEKARAELLMDNQIQKLIDFFESL